MPKFKTHSGIKKRVRVTKTGKIVRRRATMNHFLEKKSAARKRNFAGVQKIAAGGKTKSIKRQLGI